MSNQANGEGMEAGTQYFKREDVIWAAGLFEGEGCVGVKVTHGPVLKDGTSKTYTTMYVQVKMSDKDVVEKFRDVFGFGNIKPEPPAKLSHKLQYTWGIYSFEKAQAVCIAMWPWLGERRKAKIIESLTIDSGMGSKLSWTNRLRGHSACVKGHVFTDDNILINKKGQRRCKRCHYDKCLERQAKIKLIKNGDKIDVRYA